MMKLTLEDKAPTEIKVSLRQLDDNIDIWYNDECVATILGKDGTIERCMLTSGQIKKLESLGVTCSMNSIIFRNEFGLVSMI